MMRYITKAEELLKLRKNGNYTLLNDIDFENARVPCLAKYFTGTINGNGFTIRNLTLSDDIWGDEQTIALFVNMNRATITDLSFQNIRLEYQKGCYHPRIGVLAGSCSDFRISNVSVIALNNDSGITPMIYETNNCTITDVKMMCNGAECPIAYYD